MLSHKMCIKLKNGENWQEKNAHLTVNREGIKYSATDAICFSDDCSCLQETPYPLCSKLAKVKKVAGDQRLRYFRTFLENVTSLTHILSLLEFFPVGAFRRASIAKRKVRSSSKLILEFSIVACSTLRIHVLYIQQFQFRNYMCGCKSRELFKLN